MFWDDEDLVLRKKSKLRVPPPTPETGWRPPSEFPNLSAAAALSFDVECYDPNLNTHGPGWARHDGHICGLAIGAIDRAGNIGKWYFPTRHEVEPEYNLNPQQVYAWANYVLDTPHLPKVGANTLFDIGWCAEEGINVTGEIHDVQFAEALIDGEGLVNLDWLGYKYCNEGKLGEELYKWCADAYGGPVSDTQRANIYRASPRLVGPYAQSDVDLPLRVLMQQWPILQRDGLADLYRLECDLIPLLFRMRQPGVTVDVQGAERLYGELTEDIKKLYSDISYKYGYKLEGSHTGAVVGLLDHIGITYPKKKTKNSKDQIIERPSVEKEWLINLTELHGHPIGAEINDIREHERMQSTFVKSYLLEKNVNGRIFCQFHPLKGDDNGTKTGRLSSSDPNLQNIPVRTKLGKRIRDLFIKEYGHAAWEKFDYCVAPHARILTTDLRHVPANEIKIGDEIIAFDEEPTTINNKTRRFMRKSKVVAIKWLQQPSCRIHFYSGKYTDCSLEHRWLAKHGYSGTYDFMHAKYIRNGTMIPRLCDVWETDLSYDARWLAGIFDGEGWRSSGLLGVGQNPGVVLDTIRQELTKRNFIYKEVENPKSDVIQLQIQGGRPKVWEILGTIRPKRLLERNADFIDGATLQGRTAPADIVSHVEDMGMQWVIAIETEHKTMIVDGLASHNSQIEYRTLAHFAVGPKSDELRQSYIDNPDTDYHDKVYYDVCPFMSWDPADEEAKKDRRRPIKNLNFGLIYGQGQKRLARTMNMNKNDANVFFAAYHSAAPFIKPTMEQIANEVHTYGYVTTILGRRTYFNQWEPIANFGKAIPLPFQLAIAQWGSQIKRAYDYRAVNYKIQGTAAEVLKVAMRKCFHDGVFDATGIPRLTVHDELDFSRADDSPATMQAYEHLQHVLETALPLRVPVRVDRKSGPTWGKAD